MIRCCFAENLLVIPKWQTCICRPYVCFLYSLCWIVSCSASSEVCPLSTKFNKLIDMSSTLANSLDNSCGTARSNGKIASQSFKFNGSILQPQDTTKSEGFVMSAKMRIRVDQRCPRCSPDVRLKSFKPGQKEEKNRPNRTGGSKRDQSGSTA